MRFPQLVARARAARRAARRARSAATALRAGLAREPGDRPAAAEVAARARAARRGAAARSRAGRCGAARCRRRRPPRPRAELRRRAGSGRRSRSRARPARPRAARSPGCSARAMIWPISWKSSACRPRVASAGVPTRRPLRDHRRARVERHRVAVDGDADVVQAVLGLLAVELGVAQVDEHEVHVGAAGEDVDAVAGARAAPRRPPWRRRRCAPGARGRAPTAAILSATALPAITCSSGPPCWPGKTAELIFLAYSSRQRIRPPRAPPSVLWIVVVTTSAYGHRVRVQPGGDEAGEVRHVDHQQRADLVGDRAEALEVEEARVGRPAGEQQLRPALLGDPLDLVHVDPVVLAARPRRARCRRAGRRR